MLETLKNAWKMPDLRRKILYTLLLIVIFRLGSVITVPYLNPDAIKAFIEEGSQTIFGFYNVLSGGGFAKATIFAMSISPYINASIIMELLTVAIPALEKLAKEGDEGRKKITQFTRYGTIFLALVEGYGYYVLLTRYNAVTTNNFFTASVIVLSFTAGTAFLMWLGEQITEYGIGNGISILLFAGIVSRGPSLVGSLGQLLQGSALNIISLVILIIVGLAAIAFVVYISNAERRIPIQYAKRVVGRKIYGGQSTHLPMKVNMTGVLPIIFASSFVTFPATIAMFFPAPPVNSFWDVFQKAIAPNSLLYAVIYFILILFFNYFYVAVQFNPIEVANNMKKNGGFVPGIRPGKPTSDFITRILNKITLMGALFLGIIAALPIVLSARFGSSFYLGGTTILIMVGVALDTVRQLESQMLMRHYKGFLE